MVSMPWCTKIHQAGQALLGIINDIPRISPRLSRVGSSLSGCHQSRRGARSRGGHHVHLRWPEAPRTGGEQCPGAGFPSDWGRPAPRAGAQPDRQCLPFTERGEVEVKVVLESEQDGMATCCFGCATPGSAFPRAAGQHFQCLSPRQILHQSPLRGTGFGLTISRRLVNLDGGYRRHQRVWQGERILVPCPAGVGGSGPRSLNERLQHISLIADNQVTRDAPVR